MSMKLVSRTRCGVTRSATLRRRSETPLVTETGVPGRQRTTKGAVTRVFDALWCCAAPGTRETTW